MQTTKIGIDELKPYEKNNKIHEAEVTPILRYIKNIATCIGCLE